MEVVLEATESDVSILNKGAISDIRSRFGSETANALVPPFGHPC